MESIIQTASLAKHYKDVVAVSELDLDIKKGEIYGFLGLNGAGKTTTIRMLLGLISPSSGSVYLKGQRMHPGYAEGLRLTGSLVEMPHAYPNLSVRENLEIIRRLRFIKDRKAVDTILKLLELEKYANRKVKNLSLGNAQRLGLAKALIHQPEILILDEPVNGLDPEGIHDIREMLKTLAADRGVTIFISSHILGEISLMAKRIGIIHEARLISEFKTSELNRLCEKYMKVQTADNALAVKILKNSGIQKCKVADESIKIEDQGALKSPSDIAVLLVNEGLPPSLLKVEEENLESYFLRTINAKGGPQ
ncbi:ABC transporter ATP-binding protein [Saccharicrinis sp. FJH62]|uniref:ABC transporter ATP-binding protein n=1 Tax=Saccharicrinis sp. FJH62 TaxID=3344657 RepID=UPI0035D4287A